MSENDSTALEVLDPLESAPLVPWSSKSAPRILHSFSQDRDGGARALVAINAALPLADMIDKPLPVRHLIQHAATMTDENTGEIVNLTRTIIVTDSGAAYATVSKTIAESIPVLVGLYGTPPYDPALTLAVQRKRTRKGFYTLIVVPVVNGTGA